MFNKNYLSACVIGVSMFGLSSIAMADDTGTTTGGTTQITQPICTPTMSQEQCIEAATTICKGPNASLYTDCANYTQVIGDQTPADPNAPSDDDPIEDNGTGTGTGSTGTGATGGAGNLANAIKIGSVGMQLMFSPSSFASQQALGFVQAFFTCKSDMSEEEKSLALRRGANLCVDVGEYCSKKVKIGFIKLCRTKKKSYCCFNSTLARIINVEGRKQLGTFKGWGSAKNPVCEGFTLQEFNQIDISKMDLSEFVNEITAKANASAAKSKEYWEQRNQSRIGDSQSAITTSGNYAQDILTADDPYRAFSQASDGQAHINQIANSRNPNDKIEDETYMSETIQNPQATTPNQKVSQAEMDQGDQQIQQFLEKQKQAQGNP